MLWRENFTSCRGSRSKSFNAMTRGIRIAIEGVRTTSSCGWTGMSHQFSNSYVRVVGQHGADVPLVEERERLADGGDLDRLKDAIQDENV